MQREEAASAGRLQPAGQGCDAAAAAQAPLHSPGYCCQWIGLTMDVAHSPGCWRQQGKPCQGVHAARAASLRNMASQVTVLSHCRWGVHRTRPAFTLGLWRHRAMCPPSAMEPHHRSYTRSHLLDSSTLSSHNTSLAGHPKQDTQKKTWQLRTREAYWRHLGQFSRYTRPTRRYQMAQQRPQKRTWLANASLISNTSMSSSDRPACSQDLHQSEYSNINNHSLQEAMRPSPAHP